MNTIETITWFVYVLAAVLFVLGLHFMNSPKTARKGNAVSAIGMGIAVIMAFVHMYAKGYKSDIAVLVLIAGIIVGGIAGDVSAKKVKMTDMPQLVSVFNTVGGWFNRNSRPKYYCLNLAGRAFETYFDEIPIVIVKDDGSVSDVFKTDEKFSKITNVAKPTIQHVDVLLIEADRKYLFFGNGIQSEDAHLDYNRLKDALNAPSIYKK